MDVGSELRRARERRSLSLQQLSRVTKINVTTLQAVERNDRAHLPGGIYTRGLVKAYAREVGVNPEEVVERYSAQFDDADAPLERSGEPPSVSADETLHGSTTRLNTPLLALAAVAAVLIVGVYLSLRGPSPAPGGAATVAVGAEAPAPRAALPEAGEPTSSRLGAPPPESDDNLVLELQFHGPCWVEAETDGTRVTYRLMRGGERLRLEAREELVLRLGDPGSLTLFINGRPARPPGRTGTSTTVRITRQNYRGFLEG